MPEYRQMVFPFVSTWGEKEELPIKGFTCPQCGVEEDLPGIVEEYLEAEEENRKHGTSWVVRCFCCDY